MSEIKRRLRKDRHVYYQDEKFLVSERQLKGPRKTYKIRNIEKISLRRDPFYFALAFCVPLVGFAIQFNWLLYWYEIAVIGGLLGIVLPATFNLGVLFVESKALSGGDMAAIGNLKTLRTVREAVEAAVDDLHEGDDDYFTAE